MVVDFTIEDKVPPPIVRRHRLVACCGPVLNCQASLNEDARLGRFTSDSRRIDECAVVVRTAMAKGGQNASYINRRSDFWAACETEDSAHGSVRPSALLRSSALVVVRVFA